MEILFRNREEWRRWLRDHGAEESELWLIYYKKHVKKSSVSYDEAVREALCFGWIDSIVKRIDDERYKQKYTPRKPRSNWSESNKKRVKELIEQGLMMPAGLAAVERAKENGSWDNLKNVDDNPVEPQDLLDALRENPLASKNWFNFSRSARKQYLGWLKSAKRSETREKRIREIISRSEINRKPGI